MGLDARVPCNCYRLGKTKPFPLPELESHFVLEEGFWHLVFPSDKPSEEQRVVRMWLLTACEHRSMIYFSDKLARWGELAEFEWATRQVGWDNFPVYSQEIQVMHAQKSTSPELAAEMLQEFAFFERQKRVGKMNFLVHTDTGEADRSYVPDIGVNPIFGYSDVYFGFDENGAILLDPRTRQVVFRAKKFEMRLLAEKPPSKEPPGIKYPVEYVALDSNQRFVCNSPITVGFYERGEDEIWRVTKPVLPLHVEQRSVDAAHFQWITDGFKEACKASIEMDYPIFWSD